MLDFYQRIAGLKIVAQHDGVTYLGGTHSAYPYNLVIIRGDAPVYHHVSFEMAHDAELDAAVTDLGKRGIKVERSTNLPWKRSIFLKDPDGQHSEWYVRRDAKPAPSKTDPSLVWAV
jgi:catechol 2,3-dioxygenase